MIISGNARRPRFDKELVTKGTVHETSGCRAFLPGSRFLFVTPKLLGVFVAVP